MQKIALSTAVLIASFSFTTHARPLGEAGWSGEISINTGYASQTSNFNTDGDKTLSSQNAKAESDDGFLAAPLGNIAYTFGEGNSKQFYAGTSRADIAVGDVAFEIGYKQKLASGTVVDVSILPTIIENETWVDPYAVGTERKTTDESGNAYRLKLSSIGGSLFSLDFAYAHIDVDDELSASDSKFSTDTQEAMRRDGSHYYLKGDMRLFIDRDTFIVPALKYNRRTADGDAMAYNAFGADISYFKSIGRHQFALTGGYEYRDYDETNPVFGKKRDDHALSAFLAYEMEELNGWENVSLISFAGYGQSNSAITFYDESQYIVTLGLNYQF
ncbi:DUF2860 domain-containing protein [Vibrio maerlii]|uniref:DUF2860 domain-containing protein n=1 Tax=Vibrio maerlii TaxID=2231648 RepID=UPI0013DFCDA0|nr:DUF2860 domain-containing protein [Vibrio maerlii]